MSVFDERLIDGFIDEHQLPVSFRSTIDEHYCHILPWLRTCRQGRSPLVLGINGAQGAGKTTLAAFLALHAGSEDDWNVAILSIDDFYFTHAERQQLAHDVHPLLITRGVPGTHDVAMLSGCLHDLRSLGAGESMLLPRFDKATDDRADKESWPSVTGPVDLIILEGWCVGSAAQEDGELDEPVNDLERDEDRDGTWRRYVNDQLRTSYPPVFDQLDALIFLEAPGFDSIMNWRVEQEEKLAARTTGERSAVMGRAEIARFIQHYERITRVNLASLPKRSDLTFGLAPDHSISGVTSAYTTT